MYIYTWNKFLYLYNAVFCILWFSPEKDLCNASKLNSIFLSTRLHNIVSRKTIVFICTISSQYMHLDMILCFSKKFKFVADWFMLS
jgi:hypothetical protein